MNTQDLNKFGARELDIASTILRALAEKNFASDDLGLVDEIRLEFNQESGNVFLVDEDYNVAMLNDDDKLEAWLNCGNCGAEGFASDDIFPREFQGNCAECQKVEDEKEKQ